MASVSKSVSELPGVGPATLKSLQRLGIKTVADLLLYLPARIENRARLVAIKQLPINEDVVIEGEIISTSSRKSQRGALIIQAKVADESGHINCLWFNQRYLLTMLKPGRKFYFYGQKKLNKTLGHPFMVKKIIERPEWVPIYPTIAGLGQNVWRKLMRASADELDNLPDRLSPRLQQANHLPALATALAAVHFPSNPDALVATKHRLAFEELLILALSIRAQKAQRKQSKTVAPAFNKPLLADFQRQLPFALTAGQKKVIVEIAGDLSSGWPLRRLLYGEVGSGKTAVAAAIAALVLSNKQQVVILAPTTTLAAQHYQRFGEFFQPFGWSVGLLTAEKKDITADFLVATHAAFYQLDQLEKVGLVIIDEQHRFGVAERNALLTNQAERHLLMMSATPIPRSLTQTIFGALDVSYLLDKPIGRTPVTTKIIKDRTTLDGLIAKHLANGEPGYVICPLINTETSAAPLTLWPDERKTVTDEAARLSQELPAARIATLHGRLREPEKRRIIDQFQTGQIDILVSTTVVEVGIDNPNASWVVIENAERFGLTQLHQLRGRVGRGKTQSFCYVMSSSQTPLGKKRLAAFAGTNDGLKLAEQDLALRGPGEFFGAMQSGLPPLKYADWQDAALREQVFAIADKLDKDELIACPGLWAAIKTQLTNEKANLS